MDTLEFKSNLDQNQRFELIERITQLTPDQKLTLRTEVPLDYLLSDLKKKRFQGLTWSTQNQANAFEVTIRNEDTDDCCGCCGGS